MRAAEIFSVIRASTLRTRSLSFIRLVEMQNPLMQQLEKRADVLAVVKERVLTTKSCSITQTEKEQCTFQGILGLLGMLGSVKVGL